MEITKRLLDKLLNNDIIKNIYPMVKYIDSGVNWDGDEEYPTYEIYLNICLNDPSITEENMYRKGFGRFVITFLYP